MMTYHALPVGHSITAEDKRISREWLRTITRKSPYAAGWLAGELGKIPSDKQQGLVGLRPDFGSTSA